MESKQINDETVLIPKTNSKGKAVADGDVHGSPPVVTTAKTTTPQGGRWKKGIAIVDFILRLCAASAAFAAASIMGYDEQILPFFTQFLQFHAQYTDVPTFTYFIIANAIAGGYLVLSLPFSIVCIVRPHAKGPRLFLAALDTVMIALIMSAAGASTAILYLAHNGNADANWIAICQQFSDFCGTASASVVASFIASVIFIFMVMNSALALKRS